MQKKVLSHSLAKVQLGSEFHPGRIGFVYVLFLLLQDTRGISAIEAKRMLLRANIVDLLECIVVTYQSSSVAIVPALCTLVNYTSVVVPS